MWQNGACYIRVSTDDQTEFSPDAQLKAIKEYARKNDIVLSKKHIYIDEGISGKKAEKRPAFMNMISNAKLKPKPFDIILVHKFDRFARSREDSVVYKSLLKREAGIKVVSITETIEDDKFSVILEAMLEAMAEYYSLNLAEEVKKGMTEKAERGGFQTCPPFGYTMKNSKLEILPREAEFVKFIFDKFSSHEMSIRQLCTYANDIGIKTKRGSLFEYRTVEYILNNPIYIGKVRWTPTCKVRRNYHHEDTIIKEGEHKPIIDIDLWNKAHEVIKEMKEIYSKRQKTTVPIKSWSNCLIKCGNCGKTLVVNNKEYYQCNGYAKGICKVSHSIKISKVEKLILEEIKKTFENNIEIHVVPKPSNEPIKNEYELLQETLKKLNAKEVRIKEAYQDGIDTLEEYKENKTKLEIDKNRILAQLDTVNNSLLPYDGKEEIIKTIENAYAILTDENISMDIKYKTAHFLINKVTYNKKEQTLYIEYK